MCVQTWSCMVQGPAQRPRFSRCCLRNVRQSTGRVRWRWTSILSPSMVISFVRGLFASSVFNYCRSNQSCSLRMKLVLLFPDFLPIPLACEGFLHAFLFAWFQVKGVALDLFDNVLRLHLPLETTKSILQGLAFLNTNFCQDEIHLQTCQIGYLISISRRCGFRT